MFYKFDERVEHVEVRSLESICESIHPDDRMRFSALLDAVVDKQDTGDKHIVLKVLDRKSEDYRYYNFVYSAPSTSTGSRWI